MARGSDPSQSGAKKGEPGLNKYNSDIKTDVFAKDWTTPLNADNPKDTMNSPRQGGVLESDKLGMPDNPLGIHNVD